MGEFEDNFEESAAWAGVSAKADQTIAALRENVYDVLRFRDATEVFDAMLRAHGVEDKAERLNIAHGIMVQTILSAE